MKNIFSILCLAIVSVTLGHSLDIGTFALEPVKVISYRPTPDPDPNVPDIVRRFFRETVPSATYAAALSRCEAFGYSLAIVDTRVLLDEVKKLTPAELPNGVYWLGARREENFRWENNNLVDFNELEASQDGLCLTYNVPAKTIGSATCGTAGRYALCMI